MFLALIVPLLFGCAPKVEVVNDKTLVIPEDEHERANVELNGSEYVTVLIEVIDGPPIEVLFLDQRNTNLWLTQTESVLNRGGDAVQLYPELSLQGLAEKFDSGWHRLPMGEYALFIDNSDRGVVVPPVDGKDNPVTVRYVIKKKSR